MRNAWLELVPYTRTFLDLSYDWLRDPETKALTMTPDFSREEQLAFFARLPGRTDYLVWGIQVNDRPAGAAGIKRISGAQGEYWGYLGEKSLWGCGLGGAMLAGVEDKARGMGLRHLHLNVARDNERAIRLYCGAGYSETKALGHTLRMEKAL